LLGGTAGSCAIVTFALSKLDGDALHSELEARGINASIGRRGYAIYDFDDKRVESCVRLSPHYYNSEDEVNEVLDAVAQLAR
jgi:selenocysteine lyase/cysteine desulfurase